MKETTYWGVLPVIRKQMSPWYQGENEKT